MKFFSKFLLSFVLLFSSLLHVSAQTDDYNLELNLTPQSTQMLAGENNSVMLELKSTGAKTEFTDVSLEFEFTPGSNIILDEANIEAIIEDKFDSYTIEDNVLKLSADVFKSGLYYELPIIFKVVNGLTPNESMLNFTASFFSNELDKSIDGEGILVNANKPLKINKEYVGMNTEGIISQGLYYGADSYWRTRATIDTKAIGQLFIKEGSEIVIVETYDENLVYNGMHQGNDPVHDEAERTLTWIFDAPTYDEQKNKIDALFFEELIVIYNTVEEPEDAVILDAVGVETSLTFVDISDDAATAVDATTTKLFPGAKEIPSIDGTWFVPGHWGPTDGEGSHGYAGYDDLNQKVSVYPWAELSFAHQFTSLFIGRHDGYDVLLYDYYIDKNLDFKTLRVPGEWRYRPDHLVTPTPPGSLPLTEYPEYNIYFLTEEIYLDIDGGNALPNDKIVTMLEFGVDFNHGDTITREQVLSKAGLDINDDIYIAQVRYDFYKTVPGMIAENGVNGSNMTKYTFTVNPDWASDKDSENKTRVKNEMAFYGESYNNTVAPYVAATLFDPREDVINEAGSTWFENQILVSNMYKTREIKKEGEFTRSNGFGNSKWWTVNDPRIAYITDSPKEYDPTVSNIVEFLDHKNNKIIPGPNTMKVEVANHDVSVGHINPGGITSYLMVPNSVDLDLTNIVAYDNDGNPIDVNIEQLAYTHSHFNFYKIDWLKDTLNHIRVGTTLNLEIAVDVSDEFQDVDMKVFTDLINNDVFYTLEYDEPKLVDTRIVNDDHDLTGNNGDYQLLLSENLYHVVSDYYVKTEKLVKGSLDSDYVVAGKSEVDGVVTYKLSFENREGRPLSSFTLLDVLPHVGDKGITDGIERGSEFGLSLAGPLNISDKFTVYYSTATNPKRDILNDQLLKDGFDPITNPNDSEDPGWLTETEVVDWNGIKSFVAFLNEGEVLVDGEITEITFDAVVDDASKAMFADNIGLMFVAYNSFALTVNGKPTIEPEQVKLTILNVESTEITVKKVWEKAEDDLPSIQVQLYRDGEPYGDPVTLDGTEETPWTYTWTDIAVTDVDGNAYVYTVDELEVPENFIKTIDGFTITNTYDAPEVLPEEPEEPVDKTPPTGINNSFSTYMTLLLLASSMFYLLKKKKYL